MAFKKMRTRKRHKYGVLYRIYKTIVELLVCDASRHGNQISDFLLVHLTIDDEVRVYEMVEHNIIFINNRK